VIAVLYSLQPKADVIRSFLALTFRFDSAEILAVANNEDTQLSTVLYPLQPKADITRSFIALTFRFDSAEILAIANYIDIL